jgi:hypothetical protein
MILHSSRSTPIKGDEQYEPEAPQPPILSGEELAELQIVTHAR